MVEYTPNGERVGILPTLAGSVKVSTLLSGPPVIEFAMSLVNSKRMPNDGFVVRAEYAVGEGKFQPLSEQDMFVVHESEVDEAEDAKVARYYGESYFAWALARTYLHWSASAKNGERTWVEPGDKPASPGYILHGMLTESTNRGWGEQFSWNFNGTVDSSGSAWASGEKVKVDWRLTTPLTDVLSALTDDALCEWTTRGMEFRLYRPEKLSRDKTQIVLGSSPDVLHTPVHTKSSDIFTHLTVVPEKARNWLYLTNPGAPTKWGRLEQTQTQSGVESHAEATKFAQGLLKEGREVPREESFEWVPGVKDIIPWRDIRLGDRVTAIVRGQKIVRRVIEITVEQDEDASANVTVVVGAARNTSRRNLLSRVRAASLGGRVGGSGSSFPGSTGPVPILPSRPTGVVVTENTATWTEDHKAKSTVTIEWNAVTTAVDGSMVDVIEYEVWARQPHELPKRITATSFPSVTVETFESGKPHIVQVRALSDQSAWSEFSLELEFIPKYPSSVVPKPPQNLAVVSNDGEFTDAGPMATVVLGWDAVTESTDDEQIEIREYELWEDGAPIRRIPSASARVVIPSQFTAEYRVRACSAQGIWGDLSLPVSVTGEIPPLIPRVPTDPELTTGFGIVSARWDGTYTIPNVAGAHTVWVEAFDGTNWVRQGTALTVAGSSLVEIGEIGDTVQVRLVAYDQLARETGISDTVSVVREGITVDSLDDTLRDQLGELDADTKLLLRTVDGMRRVFVQQESPGDGYIGYWNLAPRLTDTSELRVPRGGLIADDDPDFVIDDTDMVGATPTGFTANGCLAVFSQSYGGSLRLIATGTSASVHFPIPEMESARFEAVAHLATPHATPSMVGVLSAATSASDPIPNEAGSYPQHLLLTDVVDGTNAALILGLDMVVGEELSWSTIGLYSGDVPDDADRLQNGDQWWELDEDGHVAKIHIWNGLDWVDYQMIADSFIARGSITGELLNADEIWADEAWLNRLRVGVIEVDMLASNVGTNLNIQGNESITLMAGRQDDTEQALDEVRSVLVITSEDVQVRTPDGQNAFVITPDGATIQQAGVAISTWDGARFISNEIVAEERLVLANHQIERFGNTRTIIRAN